jgi:hypothetical protein
MNLLKTCKLPILITCLAGAAIFVHNAVWVQLLSLLLISLNWFLQVKELIVNNNNYLTVLKRIDELKDFSLELQELVNKELALVQEDVLRIKNIVTDSIQILQVSTDSICEQSSHQYDYIQKICAQRENIEQSDESKKSIHHVRTQLQVMAEKIKEAGSYFKALEEVAQSASTLSARASIVEKVSGHKQELMSRADAYPTPIVEQAPQISQTIQSSESILVETINEISRLDKEVEAAANESQAAFDFESTKQKIQQDVMSIMRALQFEDIVSQISERVAQHVGDISVSVDILSHLPDSELSSSFDEELKLMRSKLTNIRKKLASVSAKQIANQQNMDEGDVDLF